MSASSELKIIQSVNPAWPGAGGPIHYQAGVDELFSPPRPLGGASASSDSAGQLHTEVGAVGHRGRNWSGPQGAARFFGQSKLAIPPVIPAAATAAGAEKESQSPSWGQHVPEYSKDSFFGVVDRRVCIRQFERSDALASQLQVPDAVLDRAFRTARLAPSAGNLQAYQVIVVRDEAQKRDLARACVDQAFVATAPVVLVWLADPVRSARKYGTRGTQLYCLQDATIAASYAQLALTALGLCSCWVGAFDEDAVARVVGAEYRAPNDDEDGSGTSSSSVPTTHAGPHAEKGVPNVGVFAGAPTGSGHLQRELQRLREIENYIPVPQTALQTQPPGRGEAAPEAGGQKSNLITEIESHHRQPRQHHGQEPACATRPLRPVCVMPVGHGDVGVEEGAVRYPRRHVSDFVHFDGRACLAGLHHHGAAAEHRAGASGRGGGGRPTLQHTK